MLIVQNDVGNKHSPTVIAAPITSRVEKRPLPTHFLIPESVINRPSIVLLEQLRTLDKTRLHNCIGCLDENGMRMVDEALAASVGLKSL